MSDRRSTGRFLTAALCALLAVSGHVSAQTPTAQPSQGTSPPPVSDALGRDTPFGTVTGFNLAVRRSDFVVAARYLQLSGRSSREIENISRDLNELLDRYFTQPLTTLSASPTGALDDGLAANRERLILTMGDRPVDILLTRINDPNAGQIWLFSSESLAQVPALSRLRQETLVERVMPPSLIARSFWGASLAQWILWAASIVIPLLLFWIAALCVVAFSRRLIHDTTRHGWFEAWWEGVRWLVVIGLTLATHLLLMRWLGFSLTFRYAYSRVALVVAVIISAVLAWRLVSVTFAHARQFALRRGRSNTRSLMLLGERFVKVLVVVIAVLGLLTLAGLDPTTALAGVGIAGVAVALGAQKSIENLLGAIFLLTDRALAVGDYCRVADREGWIEDITLRSVRLRTPQRTLVSIPAGLLAQGSIENFATRGKIPVQSILRLRYGTTAEQLQTVLSGIDRILAEHPTVEKETARVRLVEFGPQAVELELFAYITTSDMTTFLKVREHLLLRVAAVVESSGSAFAAPTQFIHMREDATQHDAHGEGAEEHAAARQA
jgi:MscS family membrane protein